MLCIAQRNAPPQPQRFIYRKTILRIMEKEINWGKVSEERRGKVLWLPHQQVFHALVVRPQDGTHITRVALPEQYRIRGVHYDPLRAAFGFIIESPEFPMNAVGAELPSLGIDKVELFMLNLEKP